MGFIFERSEWGEWAKSWGLTHEPQRGRFIRNEAIVGAYRGYLLRVGWGGDYGAALIILVRFPKLSGDLKVLRDKLVRHPILSTLSGWKRSASCLKLDQSSLVWSRARSFRRPSASEIRESIGLLLRHIPELIPAFSGQCEQCGASGTDRYVLLEKIPAYVCSACQSPIVS